MDRNAAKSRQLGLASPNPSEEKSALLSSIVASSEDAIVSKTLKGIITSWNPAAEKLLGYTEHEAIGKHISFIIPAERLSEEDYIIGQVSQGKGIEHFETLPLHKNGSLVPLSLSVSPIKDSHGVVIGASKIARDISERQKAAEKQSTLAAIIDSSDDTILSKTLGGIITSWNRAAERMFGYTEAEAVGKHISLIIPPERLDEETFIIGEIHKGNKVDHFQTIRMAKDGRLIPISLTVSPVVDSTGKIIGASKIARDVSSQQAAEEERARLYEQVAALNDKKDEFIGLASHELKTPLTSINGYLQILSRMHTDADSKRFFDKTVRQLKKLTALVNDLLDVSKIEAGKLLFTMEVFDLRLLVEDAIELMQYSANRHIISFETGAANCDIKADSQRIEQVMVNLLNNAVKYSPGAKKVEVSLNCTDKEATVSIKDYGVGIPADKLTKIFSRFYRVDDASPNISGLGIGLYLSHEIIARHNGKLWAESGPGKGSTFYFTLPITNMA